MILRIIIILTISLGFAYSANISGFVTDAETGEALIGANVYIKETQQGTSTDLNGYYVILNVNADSVSVISSYIGYKTIENYRKLTAISNQYNISMEPSPIESETINVSAEKSIRQKQIQYSQIKLNPIALRRLPSIGEADIFRTLQTLPGVLTANELSTGLIVRGGNTDQNLILLDGITVYNPSHLGGLFSNFIVNGLKEAELIKGGYNAEYGGRLSSVLNVLSREGNRKEININTSISLISAQATIEGPTYKNNGAWMLSGRRTYIDKFFELLDSDAPPYYFYDLQGHIFSDLSKKDRINLSFYSGRDDLAWPDFGLNIYWGNRTISTKYRRLFSEQLIGNFMLAFSEFYTLSSVGGDSGSKSDNSITDKTFNSNFQYFLNDLYTIKFGAQIKKINVNYYESFNDSTVFEFPQEALDASSYIKLKWITLSEKLIIEPGFRLNYYNKMKKTFIQNFD